jgi:hypothetical protein
MNGVRQIASENAERWNGVAGRAWVDMQPQLDEMFLPFEKMLAAKVAQRRGSVVLDLGCGTGSTTRRGCWEPAAVVRGWIFHSRWLARRGPARRRLA